MVGQILFLGFFVQNVALLIKNDRRKRVNNSRTVGKRRTHVLFIHVLTTYVYTTYRQTNRIVNLFSKVDTAWKHENKSMDRIKLILEDEQIDVKQGNNGNKIVCMKKILISDRINIIIERSKGKQIQIIA